ncbi:hypothetical protein BGX27_003426 [Mortierella sp. AM989]|nr:hypothetical protein BGX27_003426 [Mortierella sp. AM989]
MKFFAAAIALVAASVANAQDTWANCADKPDATIDSFINSPSPGCIGKQICVTATGQLSAPITNPSLLIITGKYLGQTVYTDNHDFCPLLAIHGHPCPVPATVTSLTVCVMLKDTIPANVPANLTIVATNGNGNTLFCQRSLVSAAKC